MTLISLLITSFIACNSADQSFSAKDQNIYAEDGYADLTYTPQEIVFTDMEPLITYSLSFTVESTGDATLQIDKVDITDSADGIFYVDTSATEDINLSPGVTRDFIVIAQSQEEGASYFGEARIRNNVSSASDIRIPLCGFPLGYDGALTCADNEETTDTAVPADTGTE
jgi:hypothetical protein